MNRSVGPKRGIRRRAQLRLIVDAVQPQPAGEIDQRLLFRQRLQHADGRLQRRELPVGIENVEFRVVLSKACAHVERVRDAVAVQIVVVNEPHNHFLQRGVVVGEIGLHFHGAALKHHDGHKRCRVHLGVDEFLCRRICTHLIVGRHSREIEIQHDQSAIAVANRAVRRGRNLRLGCRIRIGRAQLQLRFVVGATKVAPYRCICRRQSLIFHERNRLRLAVFRHREIFRGQPFDGIAALVFHDDVFHDQAGAAAEDGLILCLGKDRAQALCHRNA